jgi:hypothetical protein
MMIMSVSAQLGAVQSSNFHERAVLAVVTPACAVDNNTRRASTEYVYTHPDLPHVVVFTHRILPRVPVASTKIQLMLFFPFISATVAC